MTAAAQRQLAREVRKQWKLQQRQQLRSAGEEPGSCFEFSQSDLDKFTAKLPAGVVPWPSFTDDSNPQ